MNESNHGPIVGLTPEERKFLLSLSRETIVCWFKEGKLPNANPISDKVQQKLGVFVTLRADNKLRGCIGYVEAIKPLYLAVLDMTKSAAFGDPRFPPVSKSEINDIQIEISVLSPLVKIEGPEQITIGKHGLVVQNGLAKGLLLPQVAIEWDWGQIQFLKQTCAKAGLSFDAWKDKDTDIYIFSAEIFTEKEFNLS